LDKKGINRVVEILFGDRSLHLGADHSAPIDHDRERQSLWTPEPVGGGGATTVPGNSGGFIAFIFHLHLVEQPGLLVSSGGPVFVPFGWRVVSLPLKRMLSPHLS
jgi:hypothetical protein